MPRSVLAGLLLALMVGSSIASGLWPVIPSWPSGVFAWGAGLLLLSRASRLQMIQTAALLLVGGIIFAIFYPLSRDEHHEVVQELAVRRQRTP